ncbi:hypothetical protein EDD22DRAFT_844475 [Suillus occidentalis]|nr:hypothetical protein EDD22DRAFT_844475 [Suillus occidentalis]
MSNLGHKAVSKDLPQMPETLQYWASMFNTLSIISNWETLNHQDHLSIPECFNILTTVGNYSNAQMKMPSLQLEFKYNSGCMIMFSGKIVRHGVYDVEGDCIAWAWYMRDSVHIYAGVPSCGWASVDGPYTSQTSFSAKPQSSAGSKKKKRTSAVDMEGHISMLNDEIQSMHSDMSERRELKNEHYTMKMNYQSQKNKYQWRCESCSHDILVTTATHQQEQEAKDKEILCLQAAAALQKRETKTWHLKIQYESMKLCTGGGDVPVPSSSSSSSSS